MTAIMQKSIGSLTYCCQGPDAFLGGGYGAYGAYKAYKAYRAHRAHGPWPKSPSLFFTSAGRCGQHRSPP